MTALTTEEFVTWANRLAGLPWPMTAEEFARIALGEFEWKIGEDEEDFLVEFSSGAESVWIESNEAHSRAARRPAKSLVRARLRWL